MADLASLTEEEAHRKQEEDISFYNHMLTLLLNLILSMQQKFKENSINITKIIAIDSLLWVQASNFNISF